jgi:hypothetical protein
MLFAGLVPLAHAAGSACAAPSAAARRHIVECQLQQAAARRPLLHVSRDAARVA